MTENDEMCFKLMDKCHICDNEYTDKDVRVRDHCHITGRFKGSAHQECNLKLKIKPEDIKIPAIFYNLRGYDSHFIMQQIGEIAKNYAYKNKKGKEQPLKINTIPINMEKYMAFTLGNHLTFIDSFQFMSSSQDNLVENVTKCGKCETGKPDSCIRRSISDKGRIIQHKTSYPGLECKNCKKVGKSCVNPVYNNLKHTSEEFKGNELHLMSRRGVYPYDHMDSFEKFNQTELPTKEQFYSVLNDQTITNDEYYHAKKVWKAFNIETIGEYHDLNLKSDVLLLTDIFENFRKTCLQYYKLDPSHYFTSLGLSWDAMLKMTDIKLELMIDVDMFQFIEKGMRGGVSYIANRHGKSNNKYMKEYNEKAPSKYIMYLDANNLYGWAMSQYLPTGNFRWMTDKEINKIDLGKCKIDGKKGLISEVDLEYAQELHNLHNDYPVAPEKLNVSNNMLSEYCKKIAEKYKDFFKLMNNSIFGRTILNMRKRVDVRLVTTYKKLDKLTSNQPM